MEHQVHGQEAQDLKYFTPSIEDIRVGYEYERYIAGSNTQYEKQIHNLEGDMFLTECYKHGLEEGWIRVPYLTKEQIEAEGWKDTTHELNYGIWTFEKRHMRLRYNFVDKLMDIMNLDFSRETTRVMGYPDDSNFKGKCKDINTFRYICKLLGI